MTPFSDPRRLAFAAAAVLMASCARTEVYQPRQRGSDAGSEASRDSGVLEAGDASATADAGGPGEDSGTGVDACTPISCRAAGVECGPLDDGCGRQLECGGCALPLTCGGAGAPGQCGCTPARSCASEGLACGPLEDGCGQVLDCGSCTPPQSCGGAGAPGQCGCTPARSCASEGLACGPLEDDCGQVLDCGSCTPPMTCGGAGAPGVCGCTPARSCASEGLGCGPLEDGCGQVLDCGSCTPPTTCGGGGAPGACGCTPRSCLEQGAECGGLDDGCGVSLDCGGCPAFRTCAVEGTAHRCARDHVCTTDGWCWEHPLPHGWTVNDLWASDASHLWATAGPRLLQWNGERWQGVPIPTAAGQGVPPTLRRVRGRSADDVWVGGDRDVLLHFDGTAWSSVTPPYTGLNGSVAALFVAGPDELWLGRGVGSALFRLQAGSWSTWSLPVGSATELWGAAPNDLWVAATGGLAHWDGAGWTKVAFSPASGFSSVWGSGATDVWVASGAGLRHWDGASWSPLAPPAAYRVAGSGPSDVWAVTGSGVEHFDGSQWSLSLDLQTWEDAAAAVPGQAWVAGTWGLHAHFEGQWTTNADSYWPEINGLFWGEEGNRWIVGDGNTVGRWDGSSWKRVASPTTTLDYLQKVWASAPDDVWVVGGGVMQGGILHYDGTAWTEVLKVAGGVRHLWAAGPTDLWAASDIDFLAHTPGVLLHYDGAAWSEVPHPGSGSFTGLWGAASDDVWATTGAGSLLHWDGSAVQLAGTFGALVGVGGSSASDLWVAGKSSAGHWDGSSWTWTSFPAGVGEAFSLCVHEGTPYVGTYKAILRFDGTAWVQTGAEVANPSSYRPVRLFCQGPGALRALVGDPRRFVVRYDP